MDKTYVVKANEIEMHWFVVDASGQTLGRVASQVAAVLSGKHKPTFTPGADLGDHVVIVNAEKIVVTGNRLDAKMYYRHSMYPGGLKSVTLRGMLDEHPERVLTIAVRGMLPHNRYGRALLKKLKVYAGSDHPHAAQNPKPLTF
ncbi:MAG: 50S ribosomal protein L13 [Chloroflexi bacterium]|nr:50S ribosomal protein L13 [Chloroflexota bacterium]MBI3177875.1 50S ribosomal protein L13 [Chloroflexota bacterium]MBI5292837.1 50S ribosomal protein L13 [Chloroflexota bacterium]